MLQFLQHFSRVRGAKSPARCLEPIFAKSKVGSQGESCSQATVDRSCAKLFYSSDLILTCGIMWGIKYVAEVMPIMTDLKDAIRKLIKRNAEEEWFEFKENWYDPNGIGEYISSISNAAVMAGEEQGYLVWGVNNDTHVITGTTMNYHRDVKNEPLEHYLARLVTPDIGFNFREITLNRKKVIVLVIPAANKTPTAFDGVRYIRVGSSKVNLAKYPERESQLFDVLRKGLPTISNTASDYQDLTFRKLFLYYEDKGIVLNKKTFEKNLGLRTKNGEYNILAQLVSDDSHIPIRVSMFRGDDKASPLYSVREFGNNCLLLSLDKVLEYGDVINIMQADESRRVVERKEVPLFDDKSFREAIINAFVHNAWIDGNAPMITIYSDRIEILSRGSLAPKQTVDGFYRGESVPVNQGLSDMFLQLHISERSGRGVPKITKVYGKDAFEFRENSIVVTISFNRVEANVGVKPVNDVGNKVANNVGDTRLRLNSSQQKIVDAMRDDPNVTHEKLMTIVGIGKTAIQNNVSYLRKNGIVERVGSKKNGYWKVLI